MQVVAKHDAPVRHCFFVKQLGAGMLVTGGWDKTVGPGFSSPWNQAVPLQLRLPSTISMSTWGMFDHVTDCALHGVTGLPNIS
jgi:hypothetical protein